MDRWAFGWQGDSRHLASLIRNVRGRHLLRILLEDGQPHTIRDLTVQIAARHGGTSASAVSATDRTRVQIALKHTLLPSLLSAGWAEQTDDGMIRTDPHIADEIPITNEMLDELDDEWWDGVAALIERPWRRRIVTTVWRQTGSLSLDQLQRRLLAKSDRPNEPFERQPPTDATSIECRLHHVDLPVLDDANLLEYHSRSNTIDRTRVPTLVKRWVNYPLPERVIVDD